jgi:hypothetical protein
MPWRQIGGPAGWVLAGGSAVIADNPQSGDLYRFTGSDWVPIGPLAHPFIADDVVLKLLLDGTQIQKLDESNNEWTPFGPAAAWMHIGPQYTYIDPTTKNIYEYQENFSSGTAWVQIGGPGNDFVFAGPSLYGLSPDKSGVWSYSGEGQAWSQVGGPATSIYGGGYGLVARGTDQNSQYYFDSDKWIFIGQPGVGATIAVNDVSVFALPPGNQEVLQFTGVPGNWSKIGGPAANIVGYPSARPSFMEYPCLFALSPADYSVYVWELKASIRVSIETLGLGSEQTLVLTGIGFSEGGEVQLFSYDSTSNQGQVLRFSGIAGGEGVINWQDDYTNSLGIKLWTGGNYFYAIDVATGDVASVQFSG